MTQMTLFDQHGSTAVPPPAARTPAAPPSELRLLADRLDVLRRRPGAESVRREVEIAEH